MRIIAWPASGPNPYTTQLYTRLTGLGAEVVDFSPMRLLGSSGAIWHLHWPEWVLNRPSGTAAALRAAALLGLGFLARLRGTKLVWTVHNVSQHEHDHPWVEKWFWPTFIRQLSGFIALTSSGKELVEQRHPTLKKIPGFLIPHGHYRGVYPATVSQAEARAKLRLPSNAPVAVFVGQIRPYKNVVHLIETFKRIPDRTSHLVIAGQPNGVIRQQVLQAAGDDPRIHLSLQFVPEPELQVYLRAADLVVLPFTDILNSGSALLALSFDRPVLVPRRGAMSQLEEELGPEWVHCYPETLTPEILAGALEAVHRRSPQRCESLQRFDWGWLAEQTWDAFHAIRR